MKEHEILHDICEKIGYKPPFDFIDGSYCDNDFDGNPIPVDVKVMIFNSEFMEKFESYLSNKTDYPKLILKSLNERAFLSVFRNDLIGYGIHNPAQYLKDLIS